MSMSSHLSELRKKHQALSEIIEEEQRKLSSDDLNIKQLKLKKLLSEGRNRTAGRAGLRPPPAPDSAAATRRRPESSGTSDVHAVAARAAPGSPAR